MKYIQSLSEQPTSKNPCKPAQEVLFSKKSWESSRNKPKQYSSWTIWISKASRANTWWKLSFKQDSAISKVNKGIAMMKKLRYSLPSKSLITIYKAFLRTLIDYGDIIYDQPQNNSFC